MIRRSENPQGLVSLGADVIAYVTAAAALLGIILKSYNPQWNTWVLVLGLVTLIPSVGFITFRALLRKGTFSGDYETTRRHVSYRVDARDIKRHTYEISMTIRSRIDGLQSINLKYLWTGTGDRASSAIASNGKAVIQWSPFKTIEGLEYYNVCLERPLKREEPLDLVITHELLDSGGTFKPQLSMSPSKDIRDLRLQVVLPPTLPVRSIYAHQFRGSILYGTRKKPREVTLEENAHGGVYGLNLSRLKGKQTAAIYWEWDYDQ